MNGVRDSKLLSEREREALFERIANWCVSWSVGAASQQECDQLGMSAAQKLAARRAIDGLDVVPDVAVTDGKWDFVSPAVAPRRARGQGRPAVPERRRREHPRQGHPRS